MRRAQYEGEVIATEAAEPLLITMDELGRVLGSGKTTCFKLVGTGEIESVLIGRKRMPVFESVKAYVKRLREQAKTGSILDDIASCRSAA